MTAQPVLGSIAIVKKTIVRARDADRHGKPSPSDTHADTQKRDDAIEDVDLDVDLDVDGDSESSSSKAKPDDDRRRLLKAKADYLKECSGDTNRIATAIDIIIARTTEHVNSPSKYIAASVDRFFDNAADMDLLTRRLRHLANPDKVHPSGVVYMEPAPPFQEPDPAVKEAAREFLKGKTWQKPRDYARASGPLAENERVGLSRFGIHTVADKNAQLIRNVEGLELGLPEGTYQQIKSQLLERGTTFENDADVIALCKEIRRRMFSKEHGEG